MYEKLTEAITDVARDASRKWLTDLFRKKLDALGIGANPKLVDALVDHVFAGGGDGFKWEDDDDPDSDRHLTLDITDDDLAELDEIRKRIVHVIPKLLEDTTKSAAVDAFRRLKRDWPTQRAYDLAVTGPFLERLEARWGAAFDYIRMMHTISLELGREAVQRRRRSRAKKQSIRPDLLIRLHMRACQVVGEIIALMENGFADGAMARWRTLHEITVVAMLIHVHGEDIAERYVLHEAIEDRRAAVADNEARPGARRPPVSKREMAALQRDVIALVKRYGKPFKSEFGWAAHHLKKDQPTFRDLEAAAGRASLRPRYKVASYNVHAGPHGISFKLGTLDKSGLMAGASDAGFDEPGINTAYSLALMNLLILPKRATLDKVLAIRVLVLMRDAAEREFRRTAKQLRVNNARIRNEEA